MENRCVCCGRIIPEGRQICPICEKGERTISANALWSDIMMLPHNGDMISSEEVEQAIIDAPTVDAVEVVHARWEERDRLPFCPACGYEYTDYLECTNYCGNCGAKMDGGNEDA